MRGVEERLEQYKVATAAAGGEWREPGRALEGRGGVWASKPLEQRQSLQGKKARVEENWEDLCWGSDIIRKEYPSPNVNILCSCSTVIKSGSEH